MDEMIAVRHLTKRFGPTTAVDDVSFAVSRGEVLGFLGPNGAGKSTTMKMITGFLAPTSGTAVICGCDIGEAPIAAKRHIGYLPEGRARLSRHDARGASCASSPASAASPAPRRSGGSISRSRERRSPACLHQPIETLSKGFKRRVGLAQALLHDPDVLILDEPTDGLDPNQKHEVRRLISTMPEKAIVISTHILEEVDAVCTRAIVIAQGRVLADGTPGALEARSRYHNAVRLALAQSGVDAATALLRCPASLPSSRSRTPRTARS